MKQTVDQRLIELSFLVMDDPGGLVFTIRCDMDDAKSILNHVIVNPEVDDLAFYCKHLGLSELKSKKEDLES